MLVGGVIGNVVEDEPKAARVNLLRQSAEGRHITKQRINRHMVAHVIAEIIHRRTIDG